ncbi:MAG: ABC transporter permease, partial [Flammeovirgaceae bacterium]
MLKNYLLICFRNVIRNGATSFVNIFGLAVGVAATVTAFIFADQFFHTDDFHSKRDRIYEITTVVDAGEKLTTLSETPFLLAQMLKSEAAGIEDVTRFKLRSGALRYESNVFNESFYFVDNSFFHVFDFPFIEGTAEVLRSSKHIVFTKKMAEKYFSTESALDRPVSIKFGNGTIREFTVGAVIDPPTNNTMFFDFLLPMEVHDMVFSKDVQTWHETCHATFILLKAGHTIDELAPLMGKYKALQNQALPEWKAEEFKFYTFTELSTRSYTIEDGVVGSGQPQGVYALITIAVMLLILACFNYMNISLATITTRLKEIGIRKVIGARKKEIMQQFVAENFLLCLLATVVGLFISYFLFIPWLDGLTASDIPFSFSSAVNLILFFSLLLTFIVLVSGLYPAVYISRFQSIVILKGKEKFGQKSKISQVLLTAQFMLAFTTIVGCLVYI